MSSVLMLKKNCPSYGIRRWPYFVQGIIVFFILWLHPAIAQVSQLWDGHVLTRKNGLSNEINAFLYKDSRGFVWISSVEGLNRFDGRQIKVYRANPADPCAMKGNNIQSNFFEDGEGNIWFTTEKAINCYRRKYDRFDHYYVGSIDTTKGELHRAFFLEQGRYLWVESRFNIYRFDIKIKASMLLHYSEGMSHAVSTDPKSGEVKYSVHCFSLLRQGFEIVEYNDDLSIKSRKIYSGQLTNTPLIVSMAQIEPQHQNILWLATDKGLYYFDRAITTRSILYKLPKTSGRINYLFNYSDRILCTITREGTLTFFDKENKFFLMNPSVNEHKSTKTAYYTGSIDEDSMIWVSFNEKGIGFKHVGKRPFRQLFAGPSVKNNNILQIQKNVHGDIWCVDYTNTLFTLSKSLYLNKNLKFHPNSKLFLDHNRDCVWAFSRFDIGLYSKNVEHRLKTWHCPIPSAASNGVIIDSYFVFGLFDGIYKISAKDVAPQKITDFEGIPVCFYVDNMRRLWVGGGTSLKVYQVNEDINLFLLKEYNTASIVNQITPDTLHKKIWVATTSGLLSVDPGTLEVAAVPLGPILSNRPMDIVVCDNRGNIWLGASPDVIKMNVQSGAIKVFTAASGVNNTKFNMGAGFFDPALGQVYMGGESGVDVFSHDVDYRGKAPDLVITGLKIHDQPWRDSISIEQTKRLQLPYHQNTLQLAFAALEYTDPNRNQFKTRLLGSDTTWSNIGTQNFITYANLPPGRYTFQFTACNAEGIWQPTPCSLEIIIIPPYWQTWWFRSLLALAILGFVATATAFYYRYRLRAQQLANEKQQREAERQRLELEKTVALADEQRKTAESEMKLLRSQLNPHFLFNAMNSVNRYILANDKDKASEYLGQFARLTRGILENSRSLTIPLSDELNMLEQYIALENHRFDGHIHWDIVIHPDLDPEDLLVPSMFLQPFAENAILHGLAPKGGGQIIIQVDTADNRLRCTIQDNGVGRGASPSTTQQPASGPKRASVGMRLISERLDSFAALEGQKAQVDITDLKDETGQPAGTVVSILIPLVETI
jgi:ligand-binding sensor domain-containing protein